MVARNEDVAVEIALESNIQTIFPPDLAYCYARSSPFGTSDRPALKSRRTANLSTTTDANHPLHHHGVDPPG
jgi:hypothetical protein